MVHRRVLLWGFALLFAGQGARAQQAGEAVRMRAVIAKIEGQTLALTPEAGDAVSVVIAPDAVITRSAPARLSDIKAGDYIASTGVKGDDGLLHSTELRIFPAALRGVGEGQHPMQDPTKTMTNASVSEVVAAAEGQILKVQFGAETSELVVGPGAAIIAILMATAGDLKPGMKVFVSASKAADGSLTATRVFAQ
ncbi:MAG: hypothetical protein KGO53_06825 [Alphaproteobacteria bacterium]|nr:hypothetical protein [Alphaproteobacteria bacterium]